MGFSYTLLEECINFEKEEKRDFFGTEKENGIEIIIIQKIFNLRIFFCKNILFYFIFINDNLPFKKELNFENLPQAVPHILKCRHI